MAESEEDLETLLNILKKWCKQWCMRLNIKKKKIVHFRTKTQPRTDFNFKFNNEIVECVDKYKYLGIILNEYLDFNITATILASSASRALGAIYTKFANLKGIGFSTFTILFHSGVVPILDYCSGIWGYQSFGQIDTIQNRAIRFYLGVHKFAPNLAIIGDVGWISSSVRRKSEMLLYWNRLIHMDSERLTKKVFRWYFNRKRISGNWNSDIYKVFSSLNKLDIYENMEEVDFTSAKIYLYEIEKINWKNNILTMPKLRTYCTFKENYDTEQFVCRVHIIVISIQMWNFASQNRHRSIYTDSIRIQIVYFM